MNTPSRAGSGGPERLAVSTPGRICLFGEHQDYLRLPVIPCAISLRIRIEGTLRPDRTVRISLPDTGSEVAFTLDATRPYAGERDYFRSVINVLRAHGIDPASGVGCTVRGEIPVKAGTSSSSALVVSWVQFLSSAEQEGKTLSPEEVARYAYEAEVLEFDEPGGMMDQYAVALGGVLFLDFEPELAVERLRPRLGTFVLGDSGEPKETMKILSRVRTRVQEISAKVRARYPGFSLRTISLHELESVTAGLSPDECRLLAGTVRNKEITFEARGLLREKETDERRFGMLLTEHQNLLRDALGISTAKIDRMLDAALAAGALGGKINGSGGGGCMFAYAPRHAEEVAAAVERAGGKAYIVQCDEGTRAE